MSYENDIEIVLDKEFFADWAIEQTSKASMHKGLENVGKPCYYVNEAIGAKYELSSYDFEYDPEVSKGTAKAVFHCVDGHKVILHAPSGE